MSRHGSWHGYPCSSSIWVGGPAADRGVSELAARAGTNLPTGVAIDDKFRQRYCGGSDTGQCPAAGPFHIAAVVNYQAKTLAVLTIPGGTLLETIPLNNLIPLGVQRQCANASPIPIPWALIPSSSRVCGVRFHQRWVRGESRSLPESFSICLPGFAPSRRDFLLSGRAGDLNTGTNPQIAFEPDAHLAYVTPGGAGTLTAVNLSNPSQGPLKIASAQRTANIVTVTMAANTPHNIVPGSRPPF